MNTTDTIRIFAIVRADGSFVATYQGKTPKAAQRALAKLANIPGMAYRLLDVKANRWVA